jgi:hypothetical protein
MKLLSVVNVRKGKRSLLDGLNWDHSRTNFRPVTKMPAGEHQENKITEKTDFRSYTSWTAVRTCSN